jgi:hypothetical protein
VNALGFLAAFQFGALERRDPVRKLVRHGDIVVLGGPSRQLADLADVLPGRCRIDQGARAAPAATASISMSHPGLTSALTIIVAEPGRASPKCLARAPLWLHRAG